jgi:hypothetical protein
LATGCRRILRRDDGSIDGFVAYDSLGHDAVGGHSTSRMIREAWTSQRRRSGDTR